MDEKKPSRKRPFSDEDDLRDKPSAQKRVRFPKGKKVKPGEGVRVATATVDDGSSDWQKDARLAAKERARRRGEMTTELFKEESSTGMLRDIMAAEVNYEDNESFVDDGIQIEPFNLEKEREEGYFDADNNFVEFVNNDEIKDAWLDSVDVDPRFANKAFVTTSKEDDNPDLSSVEIGKIKRRIANLLEPGETVLQALKRLKGTSNNRKEKMPPEIKILFDQLTEDAVKLMENGDYNVYHENQEVFKREAEGYERLAQARVGGPSNSGNGNPNSDLGSDLFSDSGIASSVVPDTAVGYSYMNVSTEEMSTSNGADPYDMFAEDDENAAAAANPSFVGGNLVCSSNPDGVGKPLSEALNVDSENVMQNDYVYDESSGYYYSSSLGYYYDPSSKLYCCAASGLWYSFNEETGAYEAIQEAASGVC